jgi:outer membrane receptor protein involved in Fe transport
VAAALLWLLALTAFAQTTGRMEGRVVAGDGSALPGATLTLTSPELQGARVEVSGADGGFRFLGLPVGVYKLVAALDGFSTVETEGLSVRLDKTVGVEVEMSSAIQETITVISDSSALIDPLSTTGGANFNADLVKDLPVERSAWSLAFAAPGVVDGERGDSPSIAGASAAENRYLIDGLDVTDPAVGTAFTTLPVEFVKEVEIKTGGYEAEYGGALGGVLNLITRSGGNTTSFDAFAYTTDDGLVSDTPPTPTSGQEFGFEEREIGLAVGGKIIEDKLWYFAAADASETVDFIGTRGNLIRTEEKTETLFYTGKLTWQPNQSNQLVFSAFGNPTDGRGVVRNSYGLLGSDNEFASNNYGIAYNGTTSASTFLELGIGLHDNDATVVPFRDVPRYTLREFTGTAASNPALGFLQDQPCGPIDPGEAPFDSSFSFSSTCTGGTVAFDDFGRERLELRGSFTWFADTGNVGHEIKVGGVVRRVEHDLFRRDPGPVSRAEGGGVDSTGFEYDPSGLNGQRWLLFDGRGVLIETQNDSRGETDEAAVYVQDSLRIGDHLTLILGVRADSFESRGGGFDFDQGRFVDVSSVFPDRKLDFGFSDMVAPRVGFTADVTRNGRSKLYGHFGQFYESVPLTVNTLAFGTAIDNLFLFFYPTDGSLPTGTNPGTWFRTFSFGLGVGVSSDIQPMYTEEALIGFEYGVTDNVSIGVKYTERSIEDVIEDISVDGGNTYFITNPGGTVTVNPVTGAELAEPAIFPRPSRDYEALELTLNKRFGNDWQLYASYVNSENSGNYTGLDNGQLFPNLTSQFDLPALLVGAEGLLPNDREHQLKVYGSYVTPFDLLVGANAQFLSGTPISKLGAPGERFIIPRGSFGRTPDIYTLDLHLAYPIQLGGGTEITLIADIFNVTDQQEPTVVDQDWTFNELSATQDPNECGGPGTGPGTACPAGNPNFGSPIDFQRPRTLRFGLKISR